MISEIALPRGATLLEGSGRGGAIPLLSGSGSLSVPVMRRPPRGASCISSSTWSSKAAHDRSAQDFAREVDRVGGYLNAFTERDTLCFYCALPASQWRLALDVLVDLVFCAVFPKDEFERERNVIASEILARSRRPRRGFPR